MDPSRTPASLQPGQAQRVVTAAALLTALAGAAIAPGSEAAARQTRKTYTMYVAAESDDVIEKLEFGPDGFEHVKSIPVGVWPTETEGPHGIAVSPNGEYWYVTIAHGNPFGTLYKFDTESDTAIDSVELGLFPATMSISPSTGLLFAVNFNLHGDHVPSTISVVETRTMAEVARIDTGVMPHGSRMNAAGSRQYSVAMMNDELREIDAYKLRNSRVLPLTENAPSWMHYQHTGNGLVSAEHSDPMRNAVTGEPGGSAEHGENAEAGEHAAGAADLAAADTTARHAMLPPIAKPTWVTAVTPQGKVYVAGNGNATIYEVDVEAWKVKRTFDNTGKGVYNLDVTPDGSRLVATYKGDKAVGIWDTESGEELARIGTLRPIPHGVAVSADGLYAFVTIEGIGGEPGSVEAYSLATLERVGNIDIAKQAGGIGLAGAR